MYLTQKLAELHSPLHKCCWERYKPFLLPPSLSLSDRLNGRADWTSQLWLASSLGEGKLEFQTGWVWGLATLSCQKLLFMVTAAMTLGVISSVTILHGGVYETRVRHVYL